MKLKMNERVEQEISECSSGCQSGWTMYLGHSNDNQTTPPHSLAPEEEEDEEEDLSMVSDASSGPGPPHFHEEDDHCCFDEDNPCLCSAPPAALAKNGTKRRRVGAGQQPTQQEPSSLFDDTASSHGFGFSMTSFNAPSNNVNDVLEFSCGFSATHVKGKPRFPKHLGYQQSTSPVRAASPRPATALPRLSFSTPLSKKL